MEPLARDTRAWACYDCGKCTASCPVARIGGRLSPRRHVAAAIAGDFNGAPEGLAACLTCALCSSRCPAEVDYLELVRGLRERAFAGGHEPECPHGGALQSLMRMMAHGGTTQQRLGWLDGDLRTEPERGRVFLWVGCTPYYDAFFPELGLTTLAASRAAVRILNALGETPVVSALERCCGHDLLWSGDRQGFDLLARHNVELVRASGADTLVVPCAECVRTWKIDYRPFFEGAGPRILHLSELLVERGAELSLGAGSHHAVTFQDPCRLGRHLGEVEAPRRALAAVPGLALREMRRSRGSAACCAGGAWTSCDRHSKQLQVERLREARATGAEVLVTACPKCQIHLRCAMKDPNLGHEVSIEMRDVAEIVAAALA